MNDARMRTTVEGWAILHQLGEMCLQRSDISMACERTFRPPSADDAVHPALAGDQEAGVPVPTSCPYGTSRSVKPLGTHPEGGGSSRASHLHGTSPRQAHMQNAHLCVGVCAP